MVTFRWSEIFLILKLLLHAGGTVQHPQLFSATVGVMVNLPCKNVTNNEYKCRRTTWSFSRSDKTVILFKHGKLHEGVRGKSVRLRVEADCSLVITAVTAEDAGHYSCRTGYKSGSYAEDTEYDLQVVSGNQVPTTVKAKTPATTMSTTSATTSTTTHSTTTTTASGVSTATSTVNDQPIKAVWWWFVIVAAVLAALAASAVVLIRWNKTEGNETQRDENTVEPEDDVCYTSISFTQNTNSEARVLGKETDDEDEDGDVTYTVIKVSPSPPAASDDPSNLYATVNKAKK